MRLRVKDVKLSSGGVLVAILNGKDAKDLDVFALDRIRINKRITAVVNISEGNNIKENEIGLFSELLRKLNVDSGDYISVKTEKKPESVWYIKNKLDGKRLNEREINAIVKDIVENDLTEAELGFFISGCYINGLNLEETGYLTNAIAENGTKLKFGSKVIFDKHSSGGTPGNRTSMIIVPILAADGFTIPKTSSRAITSAAGTADVMEVLCRVSFSSKRIKEIVRKTNACIVWSGAMDIASADDKLIKIERLLSLDPEGILLASVLAKKKAVGSNYVLIDIPYGKGAKIETKKRAIKLRRKFIRLGRLLGMKIKVILTDGSQPVGNGIGPSLEARDVLEVLQGIGPEDLRKKGVYMAGLLLEMAGIKDGKKRAVEILESGKAYKKFKQIVKAQGGKIRDIEIAKYRCFVQADKRGIVEEIDNKLIAKIARVAGAPIDKKAGIYLRVKRGSKVEKGDCLFIIYSENKKKLEYAKEFIEGVISIK